MSALEFPQFIGEDDYINVALAQIALIRLRYLDERTFDQIEGPFLGFIENETKRAVSNFKADHGVTPVNFVMDEDFTVPLNRELLENVGSGSKPPRRR